MTRGSPTNSFQNRFLTCNNEKNIVFSIQTAEGKFPVKGSYEDSGIATGLINGDLNPHFSCFSSLIVSLQYPRDSGWTDPVVTALFVI